MANQYYKKDIHKSIEGLLYGLYVYQYLLDTSTFGLFLRCLVQDQILSLKTKAPTLRIAVYVVFAATFLGLLRHFHAPDRYSVVIDFIGNVSTPSQSKLLWLDTLIALLQITHALIVFNFRKAGDATRRTATVDARRVQPSSNSNSNSSNNVNTSAIRTTNSQSTAATSTSLDANASLRTRANAPVASSSSSSNADPGPSNAPAAEPSSSMLFEYTPEYNGNGQDVTGAGYYEDDEETRYSLDNLQRRSQRRAQQHNHSNHSRESTTSSGSNPTSSAADHMADDSDEEEEDDDPLGEDYEEVLEQETFVLQLRFQDLVSYLFSSQEPVSFPRIPDPRAMAANAEAARVQNLPV